MGTEIAQPANQPNLRDRLSTWLFEFALACCVITPLTLFRFSLDSDYTYTFPVGRTEFSLLAVAGLFSPLGLALLLVAWIMNRSRKRREFTMCAGVLVCHCGLMYGLPMLPESAMEYPDLFYIVLAGVLCITLILTAYFDQRTRGATLGFVLGLFFSPALMLVSALTIQLFYVL